MERLPTAAFQNLTPWFRSAELDAKCKKLRQAQGLSVVQFGRSMRDSIGTWSHFRPHQMHRNQITEIEHHSLSLIGLATAHNVSGLNAAPLAMVMALEAK